MPRPDDEPIEQERDGSTDWEKDDEDRETGFEGGVGPTSPLDSGLFWLS